MKDIINRYKESLHKHIGYVIEAGTELGISKEQLAIHDKSKFSDVEFEAYAIQFQGGGTEPSKFARAWLHHIHHNPHHWQYWVFSDGYTLRNSDIYNGVLPMPENYAREMIADWMGSNMAYQNTWDMSNWLNANLFKITLHPNTRKLVMRILGDIGYEIDICEGITYKD